MLWDQECRPGYRTPSHVFRIFHPAACTLPRNSGQGWHSKRLDYQQETRKRLAARYWLHCTPHSAGLTDRAKLTNSHCRHFFQNPHSQLFDSVKILCIVTQSVSGKRGQPESNFGSLFRQLIHWRFGSSTHRTDRASRGEYSLSLAARRSGVKAAMLFAGFQRSGERPVLTGAVRKESEAAMVQAGSRAKDRLPHRKTGLIGILENCEKLPKSALAEWEAAKVIEDAMRRSGGIELSCFAASS